MKFECEKTLLASAIDGVSRAITNRAAIPVLAPGVPELPPGK